MIAGWVCFQHQKCLLESPLFLALELAAAAAHVG